MAQHFITASNVVLSPMLDDSVLEGFHVYTNGTGKVDGMEAINARKYLGYIELPGYNPGYRVSMSQPYGDYKASQHSSLEDAIGYVVSQVGAIDDSHLTLSYGLPHSWVDSSPFRMTV